MIYDPVDVRISVSNKRQVWWGGPSEGSRPTLDPPPLYSLSFLSYREGKLGVNSCSLCLEQRQRGHWEDKSQSSPGFGYVNFTKVIFRRGPQTFFQCFQERMIGHYALLVSRHHDILHSLLWGSRTWIWRFKQSIKICGRPSIRLSFNWNQSIKTLVKFTNPS